MAFFRIKPVTKRRKDAKDKTYYYVYEVENYKRRYGKKVKVKQKTLRIVGPYREVKKLKNAELTQGRIEKLDRAALIEAIIVQNLKNYGFKKTSNRQYQKGVLTIDLEKHRVMDNATRKDVYIGINNGYFGTETIRKLHKFKFNEGTSMIDFVKAVSTAGLLDLDKGEGKALLALLATKTPGYAETHQVEEEEIAEVSLEDFRKKFGW